MDSPEHEPPKVVNQTKIPATYVKFVEAAGGRVVPLFTDQSDEYYKNMLSRINGVLLPGGSQDTTNSSFTRATRIVYEHSISSMQNGKYFPVWGTCQGFEVLSYITAGSNPLSPCKTSDYGRPIKFSMAYEVFWRTRLFKYLSRQQHADMQSENVVYHWHVQCLLKNDFLNTAKLNGFYRMMASNVDELGKEFVDIIEARDYPIYATMFHPEEVMFSFEIKPKAGHTAVPHSVRAERTSQYFANFFVDECRKNINTFEPELLRKLIIYNYAPKYEGDELSPYDLVYYFDHADYNRIFDDQTR